MSDDMLAFVLGVVGLALLMVDLFNLTALAETALDWIRTTFQTVTKHQFALLDRAWVWAVIIYLLSGYWVVQTGMMWMEAPGSVLVMLAYTVVFFPVFWAPTLFGILLILNSFPKGTVGGIGVVTTLWSLWYDIPPEIITLFAGSAPD